MVGFDKKIDLLNDHYKDTCNNCLSDAKKSREWLLLLIVVTLTLSLFQLFSPKDASEAIGKILTKQFDLPSTIDTSFLNSVLWFILLALIIRYYQAVIYIEKLYAYLQITENKINELLGEDLITREGKFYLQGYPHFSNLVHFLYTWIFPLLIILITFIKIYSEFITQNNKIIFLFGFNIVIASLIGVVTILYLLKLHLKPHSSKPKSQVSSVGSKEFKKTKR